MEPILKTSILLVEDDLRLAELIEKFLVQNNFNVTVLNSGQHAVDHIVKHQPDLTILDIMLPHVDGFTICKLARKSYDKPIIFLTAKDSDFDHVLGLEIGADDYIIKPVVPHVLLAHINVVLKRTNHHQSTVCDRYTFGKLDINRKARTVMLDTQEVTLTSHEFELLWLLACNAGEPQSRDFIHKKMIGREYDGLDRSVDVRISRLRKKLNDNLENPYRIKTVWGKGYLLNKDAWS